MTKRHRRGYLYRRGNVWWIQYMVDGKLIRESLGTANRADAERRQTEKMRPLLAAEKSEALAAIVARLDGAKVEQAKIEQESALVLTADNAFDEYLGSVNRPDSGESTLKHYRAFFNRFGHWLKDTNKRMILRDVTREIAGEYGKQLNQDRLSGSSFNQNIGFLRLLWKVLGEEGHLPAENPWNHVKRKRVLSPSRRELTMDELRRVCQSAEGELRPLFALGIYSGMRLGDCATLRWGETDLKRGIISRIPMKTSRRNTKPVVVPIHPVLKTILEELDHKGDYLLPSTAALYRHGADQLSRKITAHFEANKIRTIQEGTGEGTGKRAVVEVGFHSLRHTFVSLCREANAPMAVVQALVGHASPAMTRHYTHVGEVAAASAVAALPSILVNAPTALPAREPLPAWARELAEGLTAKNWKKTRDALLTVEDARLLESLEDAEDLRDAKKAL